MSKGQSESDRIKEHTLRSDQQAPTADEQARLDDVRYEGPERGPFRCDHCFFFDAHESDCEHPEVSSPVDPGGCCMEYKALEK